MTFLKSKIALGAIILTTLFATGCATTTPPQIPEFDTTRTYNQSYDKTWSKIIQFFASNSIPIKTIEKDSGIVYAEAANVPQSFAYCVTLFGDLVGYNTIPTSLNVFVSQITEEQQQVLINVMFVHRI